MACRACIQIQFDVDGIDTIIDTQILKTSQILLVHLTALEYERNPGIGTLNKDSGDIFS